MSEIIRKAGKSRAPTEVARFAGSRAGLSRDQLVDASLDLLQEAGLEALSTRRLADRLKVKSPALYWHVRNKNELLHLVADAICAQMVLPDPKKCRTFRLRLEAIAHEYRRVLTTYRDAARLFAELPPLGPHRMKLYDVAVGAYLDAGFTKSEAVAMATFYRHYLLGMIAEEARGLWPDDTEVPSSTLALGRALLQREEASRDYPNLSGAAQFLTSIQPEQLFIVGLKVLLDGMDCRIKELKRSRNN